MSVADDLEKAADILETDGWIRGDYVSKVGRCAVGALYAAAAEEVTSFSTRVRGAVKAMGFSREEMLIVWNDMQESGQPVIELMKQTAKDLRNRAKPDM